MFRRNKLGCRDCAQEISRCNKPGLPRPCPYQPCIPLVRAFMGSPQPDTFGPLVPDKMNLTHNSTHNKPSLAHSLNGAWDWAPRGSQGAWGPGPQGLGPGLGPTQLEDLPLPHLSCKGEKRRFSPSPLLKPSNTPHKVGGPFCLSPNP